ncbi:MAG: ATPase domain-containing protein [Candidatus Methanoperedens sp.]|nr:ATPase domain-containing protein [Candidatus Methanoperedens sp.]
MPDTNQSTNLERVPTDIPGFDELCDGGLLRKRTYLVSGTAGAGKTIFGIQFLYNGITKHGESGIYLSTEEAPVNVRENVKPFGWDLKGLEDEGKLAIIDARSVRFGRSSANKSVDIEPLEIRSIMEKILTKQEDIDAKRVLVGGAASIGISLEDPSKIRIGFMKLSRTLEILGLTSLIICETIDDSTTSRFGVESFVTDGTILMSNQRMDNVRVRSIEIIQMKGSTHSQTTHPYEITPKGIVVHPYEDVYSSKRR